MHLFSFYHAVGWIVHCSGSSVVVNSKNLEVICPPDANSLPPPPQMLVAINTISDFESLRFRNDTNLVFKLTTITISGEYADKIDDAISEALKFEKVANTE